MPISSLCTTWTAFAAISTLATLATFALLATLSTFAKFACYTCYRRSLATLVTLATLSSIATFYTYSLSRCIIKSHEDLNQTWKIWFSTKQRSTYSLICFDQAPNNYRVFKFPWLSFYFFPALLLVCKRRREEKSENLMVKTTLGTRISLGYEKYILRLSKRRVNVKLHL